MPHIKHINENIMYGKQFICSFLRKYKGRNDTYVFPDVEDIMEISETNIIRCLFMVNEQRNKFLFNI